MGQVVPEAVLSLGNVARLGIGATGVHEAVGQGGHNPVIPGLAGPPPSSPAVMEMTWGQGRANTFN